MSIKLTHEQAALLRSVDGHVVVYIGGPLIGDWDASAHIEDYCGSAPAELTSIGREALAHYDREWVTVERECLRFLYELVEDDAKSWSPEDECRALLDDTRAALEGK